MKRFIIVIKVSKKISKNFMGIGIIVVLCLISYTNVFATPTIQIFETGQEVVIDENSKTKPIQVNISHSQGSQITLTCESSNINLVSQASFLLNYSNSHILTMTLLPPPDSTAFIPLVIDPIKNQYGRTTITLRIKDSNNEDDMVSFDLLVNGRPKISTIPDYRNSNILKSYNIDFEIYDPETATTDLNITVVSSQSDILPSDNIQLTLPQQGPNVTMTLYPVKEQNGVAHITIQVSDQRCMTQQYFNVEIKNLPVIQSPDNWTIPLNSDNESISMSICSADSGKLTLSIQTTDHSIVPNENISIESSNTNSLSLTLDKDQCQSVSITIHPQKNVMGNVILNCTLDNGLTVINKELNLNVLNTAPQINDIPSQVINMNTVTEAISFSVTDAEGGWITLTCISGRNIDSSFCSPQGTYTHFYLEANDINYFSEIITPEHDDFGQIEFSIQLTDGLLSKSTSFSLTVNNPPVIVETETLKIYKNAIASPVAIPVIDHDTQLTDLFFSFEIPCASLFTNNGIDYMCTSDACVFLLTPISGQAGTCQITVNVSDGIGSNATQMDIEIIERSFFDQIESQNSKEDQVLKIIIHASDNDATNITQLSCMFSNPQLVDNYSFQPDIEYQSIILTLYPAVNMSGQTEVVVKMTDSNYFSYSQSFLWEVETVDDLPEISGLLSFYYMEENTSLTLTTQLLDADNLSNDLKLIVEYSSKPDILSTEEIHIQTVGDKQIININPLYKQFGESVIYFKVFNIDSPASYRLYPVNIVLYEENTPPVVSGEELSLNEDTVLEYKIKGSDAEHHSLQYFIESEPAIGRIIHLNQDSGLFTYVPFENAFGVDSMRVKAYDGYEYSEPAQFSITVLPINDAPVAYNDYYNILTNQSISIDLQAYDVDSQNLNYRLIDETITFGEIDLTDASKGIVNYIPPTDKIGQDHVWFFAKDEYGLQSNIGTITIRIENQLLPEYTLTVHVAGAYSKGEDYEYAILDATNSEEIVSGNSQDDQFTELLHAGSYQLIIISKGYEPYEYSVNTNRVFTIDDPTAITCSLKKNYNFKPYEPSVHVCKTAIAKGFILRIEKTNFDDQFLMKINNQVINTGEESWPYIYQWTVDSSPFTVSSTVQPYTVDKYIIEFDFYNWKKYVDTYSVTYYDLKNEESKKHYRSEDRVAFETPFGYGGAYGATALYETEGYSYFYPLMGNTINLRIQSGTGGYSEMQLDIPRIPLNYLIIDDPENWEYKEESDYYDVYPDKPFVLAPSDRLKITYSHYAFFMTIASGIALEFEMADGPNSGKKVRYNPFHYNADTKKYERFDQAPKIGIPILLNSNYNKFHEFSEALLDLMDTFPALVNEKGDGALLESEEGDLSEIFQRVYMPFTLKEKIIVFLQANHLTRFAALWSIPVDDDDVGQQYFHAESIDDGGCFIQGLFFYHINK